MSEIQAEKSFEEIFELMLYVNKYIRDIVYKTEHFPSTRDELVNVAYVIIGFLREYLHFKFQIKYDEIINNNSIETTDASTMRVPIQIRSR